MCEYILFEDPEDTVTRQDLDDKLVNWLYAEVDNLISELIELFVALLFIIGAMRFLLSKSVNVPLACNTCLKSYKILVLNVCHVSK